jgi:hypothetical protein
VETLTAKVEELKKNPPAIDFSDQAGEILSFFKKQLPEDTKWPKKTISELRKFLETVAD